jgi:hypothetical protein
MARAEDHVRELLKLSLEERERAAKILLDSLQDTKATDVEPRDAWTAWVTSGPQGPLEDEDEAAWP